MSEFQHMTTSFFSDSPWKTVQISARPITVQSQGWLKRLYYPDKT